MFGAFRYLLALLVVLIHVWPGFMLWTGVYAVFAFFALSGYLMALVLDRSYDATRAGTCCATSPTAAFGSIPLFRRADPRCFDWTA